MRRVLASRTSSRGREREATSLRAAFMFGGAATNRLCGGIEREGREASLLRCDDDRRVLFRLSYGFSININSAVLFFFCFSIEIKGNISCFIDVNSMGFGRCCCLFAFTSASR